jgi:hypothetical protein
MSLLQGTTPQYGSEQYIREQYGGQRHGKGPEIQSTSFLSLIKVCLQIRNEFRPLLYSAWTPIVGFRSLTRFLATFAPENASTRTLAKIIVQINDYDAAGYQTD